MAEITRNPQPWDVAREALTLEESERSKRTNCVHYESCLTYACKVNWSQFHCDDCHAFKAMKIDIAAIESCVEPGPSPVTVGRSFSPGGRGRH